MAPRRIEFLRSASALAHFPPPDLPEIVFLGRSNVGKSSLINSLTGLKNLAKVSATPGKTRLINFFLVDNAFRLVDLPGYGYAKVSEEERRSWLRTIQSYFTSERPIALALQLIDSRLPLQFSDAQMISWLVDHEMPLQIVLTKADKLKQQEKSKQQRILTSAVRDLGSGSTLLWYSAVSGMGKKELWQLIYNALPKEGGTIERT